MISRMRSVCRNRKSLKAAAAQLAHGAPTLDVPRRNIKIEVIAALLLLALVCSFTPSQAGFALSTYTCTAKPNADYGSTVFGGSQTRVTYTVETGAGEQVTSLQIALPEGTEFEESASVVVAFMSGEGFTSVEEVTPAVTLDGLTYSIALPKASPENARVRVQLHGVIFSAEGGERQLACTVGLANGATQKMTDVPAIETTGIAWYENLSNKMERQDWVQAWNSNKFLRLFLNPPILVRSIPVVFFGFLMALGIVAIAFPLAMPVGMLFALMRISKRTVLRGIASVYVNVVRGTPLFLQIYIAFFGLPLAGINIPNFPLGVIVLMLNSGAYMCEIFRAGIQSIPKGQFEASRSLGMSESQTMLHVIIPQMVRRVIPTLTSEFILLYKDTSLLAAVGIMEVVMYAKTIVASTGSITPYIVAALFYLLITLPLAKFVGKLEARLANNDGGTVVQKMTREEKKAAKAAKKDADASKSKIMPVGVGELPEVGSEASISSVELTAM